MSHEAVASCRFYVFIDGKSRAVFTEASGLQIETELMDVQEGGNNEFTWRLPGASKVSNITLKRGMVRNDGLLSWYLDNIRGKPTKKNVSIVLYDTAGEEVARWDFLNAFPVKWVGPQLTADANSAAVETLELAHEGLGGGT